MAGGGVGEAESALSAPPWEIYQHVSLQAPISPGTPANLRKRLEPRKTRSVTDVMATGAQWQNAPGQIRSPESN